MVTQYKYKITYMKRGDQLISYRNTLETEKFERLNGKIINVDEGVFSVEEFAV